MGNLRMPPLPADLPLGQHLTAYMGLLAVPSRAAFGGVVVPTTPGYLLRRGHVTEGLGGDILPLCYGFFTLIAFPWLLCLSLSRSFTAPLSLEYWSGHPLLVSPEHLHQG